MLYTKQRIFRRKASCLAISSLLAIAAGALGAAPVTAHPTGSVAKTVVSARVLNFDTAIVRGSVEDNYPVSIVVNLKLRNEATMDGFLKELHRAGSPAFHQWLSSEEVTEDFAPTVEQAQAVVDYLTEQGFSNVQIAKNRLLITADGTAAAARRAFNTDLVHLTLNGEVGIANTGAVQMPAAVADQVQNVLGLQTVQKVHTYLAMHPNQVGTQGLPAGHSASNPHFLPSEMPIVYHAGTTPTGSNTPVAIIGWGNMSEAPTDLAQYENDAGLSKVPTNIVKVGSSFNSTGQGPVEWAMDGHAVLGLSGGVKSITFYDGDDSASDAALGSVINRVVSDNTAKVINMSFGECEAGLASGPWDTYFKTGVAQGQVFAASSGDNGAYPCNNNGSAPSNGSYGNKLGVGYPSSSPYVVSVGGTTLKADANANYTSESTWAYGGGGISGMEPKPTWQSALSGNFRQLPDVSFDADGNTGMYFYCALYGGYISAGGTSLSSPLFVGAWARLESANNNGLGFASPALYAYASTFPFHDVTSGGNGHYNAGVGYDNASGLGSFDIQAAATFITNNPGFVSASNGGNGGGGGGGGTPTANFTFTTSGLTANFTDTSTDSGGSISTHSWNFGDNTTSTSANPSHTYTAEGTYNVSETVTDSVSGKTNTKTQAVKVTQPSTGGTPTANFSFVTSGLTVTFTDNSTDSGGTISAHSWNFGDNQTSTATSPSHTYAAAGTYSVSETVTDSVSGKTNTKTQSVTVTAPSGGKSFSNNNPYNIADWGYVLSPITVSGVSGNAPATLKVSVNITHSWSGDLELVLYAPNGGSVVLRNPDFNNDGNIVATYTVNASSVTANGTWYLGVLDEDLYGRGDKGTLNNWSMQF